MMFTYRLLPVSLLWEVKFGETIMAVFLRRDEASSYCQRKNAEMVR